MKFRKLFLSILVISFGARAAAADQPNIIFILADDLGYGDVQALNPNSTIPTPNMNRLVAEGMSFTDAHTPSAVCTPTRYGLLTGRYCWRSKLKRGVINGYGAPVIDMDRITVADLLKSKGYRTGIIGKWHLGLDYAKKEDGKTIDYSKPITNGPNDLGFDYSYIIPASLDFPPYIYLENHQPTQVPEVDQPKQSFPAYLRNGPRSSDLVMENCLDDLTGKSVSFVKDHAKNDDPFFLYFPLTAPHKPVLPHPRFRGKSKLGPYGDFVMQVDWTVGEVLDAIDDAGIADNTLVFFSSDNGSFMYRLDDPDAVDHVDDPSIQKYNRKNHTANGVFRGTKADVWEAGHRVAFLARWPGKITPGTSNEATICLTDVFATCAEIVGADLPTNAAEDSFSLFPLLRGQAWEKGRAPVIHHSGSGLFAIRDGDWKLVLGNGSGGREAPKGKPFGKPYQLYNIKNDVSETDNRFITEARVIENLERRFRTIHDLGRSRGR